VIAVGADPTREPDREGGKASAAETEQRSASGDSTTNHRCPKIVIDRVHRYLLATVCLLGQFAPQLPAHPAVS
jgi:hypothetical protein